MQKAWCCKTEPSETQDDTGGFEIGSFHPSHQRLPRVPPLRNSVSWDQIWRLRLDFFHLVPWYLGIGLVSQFILETWFQVICSVTGFDSYAFPESQIRQFPEDLLLPYRSYKYCSSRDVTLSHYPKYAVIRVKIIQFDKDSFLDEAVFYCCVFYSLNYMIMKTDHTSDCH